MHMDEQAADHGDHELDEVFRNRPYLKKAWCVRVVERIGVTICSDSLRWSIGSTMIGTLES
jgi:hypothetical protein